MKNSAIHFTLLVVVATTAQELRAYHGRSRQTFEWELFEDYADGTPKSTKSPKSTKAPKSLTGDVVTGDVNTPKSTKTPKSKRA